VLVGLAPKPGLAPTDEQLARGTVAMIARRMTACMSAGLNVNPMLESSKLDIQMTADGVNAPTITIAKPYPVDQLDRCIRNGLQMALGGDTSPASISFPIWIDVVQ
jgi:hypothetical protein